MGEGVKAIFIKTNNFKSKKNNKEYFTVEYLIQDGLNYNMDFISKEKFDEINDFELDGLEEVEIYFKLGNGKNLIFDKLEA